MQKKVASYITNMITLSNSLKLNDKTKPPILVIEGEERSNLI